MLKALNEIKGYPNFLHFGASVFKKTLSDLLNCDVSVWSKNLSDFKKEYHFNVEDNLERFSYVIREDLVVLSVKVYECREIIALVPIILKGKRVGKTNNSMLNQIGSTISHVFSDCYATRYKKAHIFFGEHMVKMIIANSFTKNYINTNNIYYLISYLHKLGDITLENNNYTTGFIVTRSLFAYAGNHGHNRQGDILRLSTDNSYNFLHESRPKKRFWFLVDGNSTYYICDQSLTIRDIFNINKNTNSVKNFVDSYTLSKTLLGKDVAFRVISDNQLSIIGAEGIEFVYIENSWKLRDYSMIIEFLNEKISMDREVIEFLLYYLLFCSQNNISSIIWLPGGIDEDEICKLLLSYCSCFKSPLSITDESHQCILKRLFSSDGVTVISREGDIMAHGCIVDLSKVRTEGLVGTGESAANLLSKIGIAIKISQDGAIKIYHCINQPPLIF